MGVSELSKNHGSLEVKYKYLQDDYIFFSFSTDHFPLNHDLWDGREARVTIAYCTLFAGGSP